MAENNENDPTDKEIADDNTNPSEDDDDIIETDINDVYDEALYDYDIAATEQTTRYGRTSNAPDRLGFKKN